MLFTTKRVLYLRLMIILTLGALGAVVTATLASDVPPVLVTGNPSCTDLGYAYGTKWDYPADSSGGTYSLGTGNVTWSTDGTYVDWSSTFGVGAVIVKGSKAANVYYYDPESFGDTGLVSPVTSSGRAAGLSHVEFCYDIDGTGGEPPVTVSGNPSCTDLGYESGTKWDYPEDSSGGTYSLGTGTVTWSTDGTYVDWSSTIGIDAVIIKGGTAANVYTYDPESFGDTGLVSPVTSSGKPAGLSHVEFCYDIEGTVDVPSSYATVTEDGSFALGGSVTGDVIDLAEGEEYKIEAQLIGSSSDGKLLSDDVGEFQKSIIDLKIYQNNVLVDELPTKDGNVQICFAVPPDQNGTMYFLDKYFDQQAEWKAVSEPFKTGIACNPVTKTGYYGMAGK